MVAGMGLSVKFFGAGNSDYDTNDGGFGGQKKLFRKIF